MKAAIRYLNPPPLRMPTEQTPKTSGVQLRPIPWGKRDPDLGRLVCRHMVDANPPIVIPYDPFESPRLRRRLLHYRLHFF